MYQHGPTCLEGPVTKSRAWWRDPATEATAAETQNRSEESDSDAFRADLVARVRREIAAGTYETEDKLEIALARLFHQLDKA
jgi:hypothetical protein